MSIYQIVIAMIVCGIYFMPSLIAMSNNRPNKSAIFVLNLLLGWSFVGWALAFVWAELERDPIKLKA